MFLFLYPPLHSFLVSTAAAASGPINSSAFLRAVFWFGFLCIDNGSNTNHVLSELDFSFASKARYVTRSDPRLTSSIVRLATSKSRRRCKSKPIAMQRPNSRKPSTLAYGVWYNLVCKILSSIYYCRQGGNLSALPSLSSQLLFLRPPSSPVLSSLATPVSCTTTPPFNSGQ